jgi:hypothetical protein
VREDESYVQLPASRDERDAEAEAKVGDDLDAERSLVRVAERNVLSNSMRHRMNRTNKGLSYVVSVALDAADGGGAEPGSSALAQDRCTSEERHGCGGGSRRRGVWPAASSDGYPSPGAS